MAGFQYTTLVDSDVNMDGDGVVDDTELAIFSLRYFGFLTSLAGTLICVIIGEYLKTMQHENMTTQVKGIIRYAYFIQLADYSALLATILLGITINLLLWKNSIPYWIAIFYNVLSLVFGSLMFHAFMKIIAKKQPSRLLYDDDHYKEAIGPKSKRTFWEKVWGLKIEGDM